MRVSPGCIPEWIASTWVGVNRTEFLQASGTGGRLAHPHPPSTLSTSVKHAGTLALSPSPPTSWADQGGTVLDWECCMELLPLSSPETCRHTPPPPPPSPQGGGVACSD